MSLEVGTFAETVDVAGASPILKTSEAALGSVIPEIQVANLPLAIRNWDDLLALVPGVQGDRYTEQGGGTSFGRTGGINVHGARALQNNFLLDGVDNNSISENVQELTTQVSRPSVDAIQEFKVVTSPVLGGVRAVAGRRNQCVDQVGHQLDSRHRLRGTSATSPWTPPTSSPSVRAP